MDVDTGDRRVQCCQCDRVFAERSEGARILGIQLDVDPNRDDLQAAMGWWTQQDRHEGVVMQPQGSDNFGAVVEKTVENGDGEISVEIDLSGRLSIIVEPTLSLGRDVFDRMVNFPVGWATSWIKPGQVPTVQKRYNCVRVVHDLETRTHERRSEEA
ncbi:hypothetical protein B0H19DRAFT_1059930 [Mycena capillaripes]|nr:hypothetical protein B0H19DRAFT_1059930 [Mycena capillaripes]